MKLILGITDIVTRAKSRPGATEFEFPVELKVPGGFGTSPRHTKACVKVTVMGYLNGDIGVSAEVVEKTVS